MSIDLDDKKYQQLIKRFKKEIIEQIRLSLLESMRLVGIVSTSSYMSLHKLTEGEYGIPGGKKRIAGRKGGKLLGILTSRLMRSILDQEHPAHGRESIRRIKVSGTNIFGEIGSRVPYALIHEKGGIIQHNNLWGRGISANIEIPARPYLLPAINQSQNQIQTIFSNRLASFVRRMNR